MRNFKSLCVVVLSMAMMFIMSTTAFAAATSNSSADYYSIVNSPEWSEMSRVERVAACQLSAEELQSLTTDELVRVVLDYPFFVDAQAFNTEREGFLRVLEESTALQELLNREDKVDALMSRYAAIDIKAAKVNGGDDFSDLWKLEILLAQPEISDLMDEQQIAETFDIAEKTYEDESFDPELYQGITGIFFRVVNAVESLLMRMIPIF